MASVYNLPPLNINFRLERKRGYGGGGLHGLVESFVERKERLEFSSRTRLRRVYELETSRNDGHVISSLYPLPDPPVFSTPSPVMKRWARPFRLLSSNL